MITAPLHFRWTGATMEPIGYAAREADKLFVIGERYQMEVIEERSVGSHRHYFAAIKDIWDSFPDDLLERWPTVEHLRKYALIKCGYADERSIVCSSEAEADRLVSFMKPMAGFSIVTFKKCLVRVFEAKSQSARAMGKKEFEESKDAVLRYCEGLIGVEHA